MIDALQSNFLQASELEVLGAVLRWGEQELIRRMEDREPNLLSHTAHSVTRKGIKKRDLSDIELREILSELLPHVRMDHVLPPNNETLHSAIRRGLVSSPPSHMIGGDDRENIRINAWTRGGKNHGLFVRPRLFMPYFDEVKSLLEDHNASQQIELLRLRRSRHYPDIPDTLYMVSRLNRCSVGNVSSNSSNDILTAPTQLDVVTTSTTATATSSSSIPSPDAASMEMMQKREQKLRQTSFCQRALSLSLSSKHEIYRQIRLRVVREFNFPDEVSVLLENSVSCFCNDDLNNKIDDDAEDEIITGPSSVNASNENIPEAMGHYGNNLTFPRQGGVGGNIHPNAGSYRRLDLPSLVTEGGENYLVEGGVAGCSENQQQLSLMMPDVTASLGQIQIDTGSTSENLDGLQHLDLGDGTSHIVSNQPRSAQSMQSMLVYHGSFIAPTQATHRMSTSSVGSYHHYMTRYLAPPTVALSSSSSSSGSSNQPPLPNSPLAHASSSQIQMHHHLSNQVPSNSQYVQRRAAESSASNFRPSSSHSHSSSFL